MASKIEAIAQVRYGSPEAWPAFRRLAKVDLLPVVSDPTAEISPRSTMRSLGKTPSLFNDKRQVIGFTDWTMHEATVRNIDTWSKESDYGICIQTRRFRAIDIDVDDRELADELERQILELLGVESAPCRIRSNSGKRLLLVLAEGGLGKDAFPVREWIDEDTGKRKRWLVELLATGQQFIAAGTHTSGVPYEWRDGIPDLDDVPVVTVARLQRAFDNLKERHAIETWKAKARHAPTLLEELNIDDPVAEHLIEQDLVLGEGKGQLYVECPWKDGHSSDNGKTETSWLLAGSGKYRNGHFSCRHAGCSGRKDTDFLREVEYRPVKASEFDDLTKDDQALALYEAAAPGALPKSKELKAQRKLTKLPMPGWLRNARNEIETCLENVLRGLRAPQAVGSELIHDRLRDELMLAQSPGEWRRFVDADAVRLRMALEALGFKNPVGRELMRDALTVLADEKQFDSAEEWVMRNELKPGGVPAWDGVKRMERFYPDYLNTEDTPYARALGLYSWTAQAGRVLQPGCQVDMVPVLVSPEGFAKTSVVRAIAPAPEFFSEFSFEMDEKERTRLMIGCLVGELSELRGIGARDGEAIKSWVTRRVEEWVPKYMERKKAYPRRLVLYGTTNDEGFLKPHMGERRWLPVRILRPIDVRKIERDRLQLWAEARDHFLADGVAWEEVQRLAEAERAQFKDEDVLFVKISKWLDQAIDADGGVTPKTCGSLRTEQVAQECLGIDPARLQRKDEMRIADVLRNLGMVSVQKRVGGIKARFWVDKS